LKVWRKNQFDERIAEKELISAVVGVEAHFVKVGREVLRRYLMPPSSDAALEKRKWRFDGVSVKVSVRVFSRVIDGLVETARQKNGLRLYAGRLKIVNAV